MFRLLCVFIFSTLSLCLNAQTNGKVELKYLIATGTGHDFAFCDEDAIAKLELNDTTFIPFNRHRTFESELNRYDAPVSLDTGIYRILLVNRHNEVIDSQYFHTDSILESGGTVLHFSGFDRCCQPAVGRYLFFRLDKTEIVPHWCQSFEATLDLLSGTTKKIKITGIQNDSIPKQLAESRAIYIQDKLISNGISADRIEITTGEGNPSILFLATGLVYPPADALREEQLELGIYIEIEN